MTRRRDGLTRLLAAARNPGTEAELAGLAAALAAFAAAGRNAANPVPPAEARSPGKG